MTVLAAYQIAGLWAAVRQGLAYPPTSEQDDIATAVALAESGGTTTAISPTSDYGLWQIHLPLHLGTGGITWTNWMTPTVNSAAAFLISTGGTNWGPWCTCWATPARDCATGKLAVPQAGSAASAILSQLVMGGTPTPPPVVAAPGVTPGLAGPMWTALVQWVMVDSVELYQVAIAEAQAAADI